MIIIEKMHSISLSVTNLDDAVDFYKEIFGFDVIERQSGSDEVLMQMSDIVIRLLLVEDLEDNSRVENYVTFYIDEDDFDDALDEIEANELDVVYGPENVRNGRKVIVADPFDNRIGLTSVS